jgi:CO/xanthine dehydrogenase Mo-binding subunit/CO/xanthine dehydrogenase FAD-binding subunit
MSIGKRVRAIDWEARTLGRVRYAADLPGPPHLHAAIRRSPHPFAEIRSIDTRAAERLAGVRAIITIEDFEPGVRYIHRGPPLSDRPPLADGLVRHVGQEVAAVAADTLTQAQAACALIDVRYRRRRAALDVHSALRAGAPTLHERVTSESNVAVRWNSTWGDPEAGEQRASVMVDGRFVYPSVAHACMEPNITLAAWDEERQILELWTSTQAPWFIAKELSHLLGLEHDQVICREVAVGGGFGSKSKASEHEVLAAALACKAGRPVLLAFDREQEFAANKPRHRFETRLRTGADASGRITFSDAEILVDNGSYNHTGSSVLRVGVITLGSMYRLDGVRFDARLVDTATQPGGQFRGYGTPQVSLAFESQVDELAHELGIDPIEFRLRNAAEPHTTTLCGYRVTTSALADCLTAVRDELGWADRERRRVPGRGWGVAAGMHGSGAYAYEFANRSDAAIDVYEDGHVRVRYGGADAGTGQSTILAQIVADELGVPLQRIEVLSTDGEQTPFELGAWSSRATHMTGFSVGQAAREMAEKLRELARSQLAAERIELHDGAIVTETGSIGLGELVRRSEATVDGAYSHETSYLLDGTEMITPGIDTANLSPTYAFAAHGAEVEVDTRTGNVRIRDYVAAHDVGRAVNPTFVEGQIVGGAAMGIGGALGEELVREGGRVVNSAYVNYALPRSSDLPSIRPVIVEAYDPAGPYGAKSVGEMAIVPPGAAIANAVYDAVGVRIRELPITPDKVLTALARKAGRSHNFALWRRPSRWWVAFVRAAYSRGLHALLHRYGARLGRRVPPDGRLHEIEQLVTPTTVAHASDALRAGGAAVGGGTDVITELRLHTRVPRTLVSLRALEGIDAVAVNHDGALAIGAGVTLARLIDRLDELELLEGLREAARTIASPQIRNNATVGGNLAQTKRCWFFRNGFACYKRSGPTNPCYAVLGDHRFQHAPIGAHRCQAVTPSDLATALVAYDAEVVLAHADGRRVVALADFYRGPGETVLRSGELIFAVRISAEAQRRRAVYEKLALVAGDFAIVAVALTAAIGPGGAGDVRLVLGAMAPTPLRLRGAEATIASGVCSSARLRDEVDRELDRIAHPLPGNGWKLDAAAGLVQTAAERLGLSSEHSVCS